MTRLTRIAAAAACAPLVLAAGCGGGGEEEQPAPTPSVSVSPSPSSTVEVPADADLTEVGAELSFGETATVIYEPDQKSGSVLELTVKSATEASPEDFAAFILPEAAEKATPYYVDVQVENVGEGDVGGGPVPLWGVDADNTLLPPANITTAFRPCPSEPLPKKFGPGERLSTCLVYFAPERGTMEAVSFRPNQEFDPIVWTGEIAAPEPDKGTKQGQRDGKQQGQRDGAKQGEREREGGNR
jgi:hypothetical protein